MAAICNSDLPAPARLIALILANRADTPTGRVKLSQNQIAAMTGLGRSTVKRHLETLEARDYVRLIRPPVWAAAKHHERTEYVLLLPREAVDKSVENSRGWVQSEPRAGSRVNLGLGPEREKLGPERATVLLGTTDAGARDPAPPTLALVPTGPGVPPADDRVPIRVGSQCLCLPPHRMTSDRDCLSCGGIVAEIEQAQLGREAQ